MAHSPVTSSWLVLAIGCALIGCGYDEAALDDGDSGAPDSSTSVDAGTIAMMDAQIAHGDGGDTDAALADGGTPGPHGVVELERACGPDLTLEISVLADSVLRLRFVRAGKAAPDRGWTHDLSTFSGPNEITIDDLPSGLSVRTASLELSVSTDACLPVVKDLMGRKVWTTRSPFSSDKDRVSIVGELAPEERIFGLGEKTGKADRRGRVLTNWNSDPAWSDLEGRYRPTTDPLYQSHPFFMSVLEGKASGVYLANTHRSVFDLGKTESAALGIAADGGEIDLFVFEGPAPSQVLEHYSALVGRTELPPLWALGYHQARWSYTPDARVSEVAAEFRERMLPADGIWLDIDYMDGYRSFTWHKTDFADPKQLVADLEADGFKVTTILDPGIKFDPNNGYGAYDRGTAQGAFILGSDGEQVQRKCWPDFAVFPDFSSNKARRWWGDELRRFYEDSGVRGTWIDMNEPAVFHEDGFPLDADVDGEGTPTNFAELRNVYAHLMAKATYDGALATVPDRRPFILTRAGFAGTQKYAAVWTGDAESEWETLDFVPAQLQGMSLSGIPFVGSDVGGFSGAKSPEMYARWFELGTVSPFFRRHVATGKPDQEPWAFGEQVENAARELLTLRYALLPYWYQLFVQASASGAPTLRPLWWEDPSDVASFAHEDQFFVGPSLLVVPVTEPGVSARSVYLPSGPFVDFHTGERHLGPKLMQVPAPIGRVPMFVRGGAILPGWAPRQYVGEEGDDTLFFDVYAAPAGTHGALSFYEDDGATLAYKRGVFSRTELAFNATSTGSELTMQARVGEYQPQAREISVRLHGLAEEPSHAEVDNKAVTLSWDQVTHTASLSFADDGAAHHIVFTHGADGPAPIPLARLTFQVSAPANTPGGDLYLATSAALWEPGGVRLARNGDQATGVLSVSMGTVVEYKVTRGTWGNVEKDVSCAEIENRVITATDAEQTIEIAVASWADQCQ